MYFVYLYWINRNINIFMCAYIPEKKKKNSSLVDRANIFDGNVIFKPRVNISTEPRRFRQVIQTWAFFPKFNGQ